MALNTHELSMEGYAIATSRLRLFRPRFEVLLDFAIFVQ